MDEVEIAGEIREGKMSAEEAIAEAVKRAKEVDSQLNAIIAERCEAAIEEARSGNFNSSGPLTGVPTLVKYLGTSAQGEAAYEGNRVLKQMGHVVDHDCHAVAKMKQAGLISIGRTNVPEFAAGMSGFADPLGSSAQARLLARRRWRTCRTNNGAHAVHPSIQRDGATSDIASLALDG